jgi:hypothetical protein
MTHTLRLEEQPVRDGGVRIAFECPVGGCIRGYWWVTADHMATVRRDAAAMARRHGKTKP